MSGKFELLPVGALCLDGLDAGTLGGFAALAEDVDLQAVSYNRTARGRCNRSNQVVNITAAEIVNGPAAHAHRMVVMSWPR
jgi:uncharacterized protein YuzB (UPF0349 family)